MVMNVLAKWYLQPKEMHGTDNLIITNDIRPCHPTLRSNEPIVMHVLCVVLLHCEFIYIKYSIFELFSLSSNGNILTKERWNYDVAR